MSEGTPRIRPEAPSVCIIPAGGSLQHDRTPLVTAAFGLEAYPVALHGVLDRGAEHGVAAAHGLHEVGDEVEIGTGMKRLACDTRKIVYRLARAAELADTQLIFVSVYFALREAYMRLAVVGERECIHHERYRHLVVHLH